MSEQNKPYIELGLVNLTKLIALGDFDLFEKENEGPATFLEKEELAANHFISEKDYKGLYRYAKGQGYATLQNSLLSGQTNPKELAKQLREDVLKQFPVFAGPNEDRLLSLSHLFPPEDDQDHRLTQMKKAVTFLEGLEQKDPRFLKRALESDPHNIGIPDAMANLLKTAPLDSEKYAAMLAIQAPKDILGLALYNECFDPKDQKLIGDYQAKLAELKQEGLIYDEKAGEVLIRSGLAELAVIRLYNTAEAILKVRCPAPSDDDFDFFTALNHTDKDGNPIPHQQELHELRKARNSICHANKKYDFTSEDIHRWQKVVEELSKGE